MYFSVVFGGKVDPQKPQVEICFGLRTQPCKDAILVHCFNLTFKGASLTLRGAPPHPVHHLSSMRLNDAARVWAGQGGSGLGSAPRGEQAYFSLPISHTPYRLSPPVPGSVLSVLAKVVSFLHLRNTSK